MPEPALPEVPGDGPREVDGRKRNGTAAGSVFPRGLYVAASRSARWYRRMAREICAIPVPCSFGDTAHDCSGPETAGCGRGVSRCSSYVGTESAPSSASALRRSGRRHQPGRRKVDWLPETIVPSAGTGAGQPVPGSVFLTYLREAFDEGRTEVPRRRWLRFARPGMFRRSVHSRVKLDQIGSLAAKRRSADRSRS